MNQEGEKDKSPSEHQTAAEPEQDTTADVAAIGKEKETTPAKPRPQSNQWNTEERSFIGGICEVSGLWCVLLLALSPLLSVLSEV